MLGLLFIYWIWKAFTNLAFDYGKSKWKYFFIGIGTYYGGSIIGAFIVAIVLGVVNGFDSIANENFVSPGWNVLFAVFGGLVCYLVYGFMDNKLEKERELIEDEGIDTIGLEEKN